MSEQTKQAGGAWDGWTWAMVAAVLAFTVGSTWQLVAVTASMGGLALLVRQAAAVLFTDGALLYWHIHRPNYPTEKQRKLAGFMLWEALALVLFFAVAYMLLSVMGAEWSRAIITVTLAGYPFEASITGWLEVGVLLCLAGQAALTLYAVLKIAALSPDAQMTLRRKKAEQEVTARQLDDYETAQRAIAPIVGQAQAIAALRAQLAELGYNERERERLVGLAMAEVQASRAPNIGTPAPSFGAGTGAAGPVLAGGLPAMVTAQEREAVPVIPFGGNGHKK